MLQQKRGSNRPHQTSIFIEVFIFYCITQTSPIDMDNFSFAHTLFCHHGRTSEILEGVGAGGGGGVPSLWMVWMSAPRIAQCIGEDFLSMIRIYSYGAF